MGLRELKEIHLKIRANAMALVDHVDTEVDHEELGKTTYSAPGLIAQLREAVSNSMEIHVGNSGGKGSERIPISTGAFDLLASIADEVEEWRIALSERKQGLEGSIIVISALACRTRGDVAEGWMVDTSRWIQKIRDLFDPPSRYHLSAPCPKCNNSTVKLWNMTEQGYVNSPALNIMTGLNGPICKCLACGAEWQQDHFLLLARAIGC